MNSRNHELVLRALDSFLGDVEAGVIAGVDVAQIESARAELAAAEPVLRTYGATLTTLQTSQGGTQAIGSYETGTGLAVSILVRRTDARPTARLEEGQLLCGHEGCDREADRLVEEGYSRFWRLRVVDDQHAQATFNGSEDFSEAGDGDYFAVCSLGHESILPLDVEFD